MRYLGIDFGLSRIGIAVSDMTNTIATPLKKVDNNTNKYLEISNIMKEYEISTVILGLPKNMNNSLGKSSELVLEFKEELEKNCNASVILQDERLTTVSANKIMTEKKVKTKNKKNQVDSLAASLILQVYLDKIRR